MARKPQPVRESLPDVNPAEAIAGFEKEIANQENILYGIALFFEGISAICRDSPESVEAQQAQFRKIIQTSQDAITRARTLLEQVKKNPAEAGRLAQFQFAPCEGHPRPGEMIKRARILARAYQEVFPNRPRDKAFTETEIFRLMEAAGEKLE